MKVLNNGVSQNAGNLIYTLQVLNFCNSNFTTGQKEMVDQLKFRDNLTKLVTY